jgi:metallophosphoesterase superfamily enzyme
VRGGYALAGHIHPAVRLTERGGQSLRLPCFWFGARVGVLPAFGAFTGSARVRPRAGDQVFVVADGEVIGV